MTTSTLNPVTLGWRSGNPAFQGNVFSRNLEVVDRLKRFAAEQLGCSVAIGGPSPEAMPSADT